MLKLLILLVIAGVALCATPTKDKPVIVVGAGASGIAAAATLNSAGIPVILLEARNRTGGRVWSDRTLGYVAEMGASWMNGLDTNTLTPIARQMGVPLFGPTPYDNMIRHKMDGTAISAEDNAAQQQQFSEVSLTAAAGAQDNNGGSDVTFSQAFDIIDQSILQDENLNWFITTSMESDIGGPIESTSAAYGVSGKENSGGDYLLPNGYDQILNYIGRNVTPVLNTQVTGIDHSSADQVTVTTDSGTYIGSHVIVTVPLGVLKKGIIAFTPKLPETKQQAIDTLLMGTLNKVWLKFPNNDWKGNTTFAWGLNKGITKELRGRLSWFLNTGIALTADPTAMLVFAMGQAGIDIENESDEAVIAEIMTSLKLIFGDNVPEPTGMVRSKWSSDPYTYGCYAYAGVGATSDSYATVGEPVGTTLYFAGEHTNVNYKGYVHGAYQSGLRAANELMVTLGVATAAPAETTGPPNAAFNNNHYQKPGATARPRTTRAVGARSSASTATAGIVLALLAVLVHFA